MKPKIHAAAGGLAALMIVLFWLGTAYTELLAGAEQIARVKTLILYGMGVLIPALMVTGGTGFALGRGWKLPLIAVKARRMKLIALNGVVVLLPSAIALAYLARMGRIDGLFYLIQAVELAAGAVNLTLISLNMKAGLGIRNKRSG